jgi:hypothetical protein
MVALAAALQQLLCATRLVLSTCRMTPAGAEEQAEEDPCERVHRWSRWHQVSSYLCLSNGNRAAVNVAAITS